jgi:hypothetical protein
VEGKSETRARWPESTRASGKRHYLLTANVNCKDELVERSLIKNPRVSSAEKQEPARKQVPLSLQLGRQAALGLLRRASGLARGRRAILRAANHIRGSLA